MITLMYRGITYTTSKASMYLDFCSCLDCVSATQVWVVSLRSGGARGRTLVFTNLPLIMAPGNNLTMFDIFGR